MRCIGVSLIVLLALSLGILGCEKKENQLNTRDPFVKAELEWRKQRDERMRQPTSWLTIAGLFWLHPGENTFGSGTGNDIRLPAHSAPERAGTFLLENGDVRVMVEPDVSVLFHGKRVREMELKNDHQGEPDVLELGDLRMWVIKRSDRLGIRLRDLKAKRWQEYHGLSFFPPSKEYRVKGKLKPFEKPKKVTVGTVVGTEAEYTAPGMVEFKLKNKILALEAFQSSPESKTLFFIFKDATNGKSTYGAGRFLYASLSKDGTVELNFNRAVNPPCAYTPFATCPLPPQENNLPVAIEAGEKSYEEGH